MPPMYTIVYIIHTSNFTYELISRPAKSMPSTLFRIVEPLHSSYVVSCMHVVLFINTIPPPFYLYLVGNPLSNPREVCLVSPLSLSGLVFKLTPQSLLRTVLC